MPAPASNKRAVKTPVRKERAVKTPIPKERVALDPAELDPHQKPFWGTRELHRVGLGYQRAVLDGIHAGRIPALQLGRKYLIPTAWVRRQMQLDDRNSGAA